MLLSYEAAGEILWSLGKENSLAALGWRGRGGQKPLGVACMDVPLLPPPDWFALGPFFLIICHPWKRSHGGRIWPHSSFFSSNWLRKYGQGGSLFPSVALEDRSWLSHPGVWTQLR